MSVDVSKMSLASHPNAASKVRTHREAVRFTLDWTIENFKTFRNETRTMYGAGMTMGELGMKDDYEGRWFISAVPCFKRTVNGSEESFISLFLNIWDTDEEATSYSDTREIPAEFSTRVTTGKTLQAEIWSDDDPNVYMFSSVKSWWGWNAAISHADLFGSDEVPASLKDDCITVSLDVVVYKQPQNVQVSKTVVLSDPEHYQNFAARQLDWFSSQQQRPSRDLDFVLQSSDGKEFHISRWIWMAHSPVFAAMLKQNTKEKKISRCEMVDIDGETTEIMVNYLYGCCMETINKDNVEKVLIMADKYQLMDLLRICEELLANSVTVDKAVHLLVVASQRGLEKLKTAALNAIPKNMATVLKNGALEEVVQADPSLIQTIMEHCSKRARFIEES